MEQRADETTRLSRIAAEDAGPPAVDDTQVDAVPAADEDAGEANGRSPEEPAAWTPGRAPGEAPDGEPGYSAAPAGGTYPPASTYPSAGHAYPDTRGDGGYSSTEAAGAYAGPTVDDGYGPPGTERDYSAPSRTSHDYSASSAAERDYSAGSGSERDYPASSASTATSHDFPASSATADREYPAPPGETVYGSSGAQPGYSDPPYPAQVSSPAPESEPDRADRAPAWQAATARLPRPQAVPKRPKTARTQKDGSSARQAHLTVARLEPWSVMKFSFMISLVCFVILFVAMALLYGTLAGLGVFDAIQKALTNVTSGQGTTGVNVSHWFSASTILGYTALLGALDVVLITAFATVGSVVYNLTSHLVGGVEVTLKETE